MNLSQSKDPIDIGSRLSLLNRKGLQLWGFTHHSEEFFSDLLPGGANFSLDDEDPGLVNEIGESWPSKDQMQCVIQTSS